MAFVYYCTYSGGVGLSGSGGPIAPVSHGPAKQQGPWHLPRATAHSSGPPGSPSALGEFAQFLKVYCENRLSKFLLEDTVLQKSTGTNETHAELLHLRK